MTFLNHGSFGACPRPVFERYQTLQRELERQPVEFLGRRVRGLMADARQALASYLGADADEIVYFPNVTTALNVVARSLPLEPGDEILTADHEYGALRRTWTFVSEHRDARPVVQALPTPVGDPQKVVETIWAGVTPRTRVLFLSHITSPTAIILPIEPLVARAREAGIWTVIDGAHAPGQVPIDLHTLGIDFYGGNCHKWLSSPKGAGFLYVRKDLQDLIEPLVISWGWRPEEPGDSVFVDQLERQATHDPAAALSVPAAIQYQAERDWAGVRAECHELVRLARFKMAELTGVEPLVPDDARWFSQMAVLPLPPCDALELKRRLWDEYRVEIPQTHWGEQPCLRISVQGYNTRTDIERLVDAVGKLLPQVRQ
ncbi:MAG: aminotransferase class V-fold PLP-dependent enzyme [Chloroflexi bacterium]|nr:aminotransferase class V-fold PLP-dependent enzyme [Chloroflexota bacterium]MBV9543038.1 aminotransferase class V-fold PLP-dependent enzyme [Chloroflexota bacterium]